VQQADDQELEQDGEQLCGILHGHKFCWLLLPWDDVSFG
jgi:hypothetical protein